MSTLVIKDNQISLNGQIYSLSNTLKSSYVPRTVPKTNTGSDSFDKEAFLSNYSMNDLRGGIGADEYVSDNRYWFGDLITSYKNHIRLPRLATTVAPPTLGMKIADPGFETWTDGTHLTNWAFAVVSGTPTLARDDSVEDTGTYCASVVSAGIAVATLTATLATWSNDYRGKTAVFYFHGKRLSDQVTVTLDVNDGVGNTTSDNAATGDWAEKSVTHTFDASATQCVLTITFSFSGGGDTAYVDSMRTDLPYYLTTSTKHFANFNSNLYLASGNCLLKINTGTGASWTLVESLLSTEGSAPQTITAIAPSLNSKLYIFLGDSVNYYHMSTAEAFTQSNSAATYAIQYDAKLFKCTTAGVATYSVDPDAVGPTWTTCGNITDIASEIETFDVGPDSTGAEVLYCATNSVLKILDLANAKWEDSSVKLPNHPNGGKGFTYWRDALYLSYGLGVKRYVPENALVQEIGLTKDGGLPSEYNGEIVKFLGDSASNEMFALIDASQVTGTAKSGLYAYDGNGWFAWWLDTNNDGAMNDCIISSAYGYRLWWDCGGATYYIDIPRGITNPSQVSTTHAASGFLVSSWLDKGTAAYNKLIKRLTSFAKSVTATETIVLKYRTDKATTALASTWTTLDTLNASGDNGIVTNTLASGAGVSYGTIQFRIDMAGAAGASPDLQALTEAYRLITGGNWVWEAKIKLDGLHGRKPRQQLSDLETVAESATDVAFIFREDSTNETHYVKAFIPKQDNETGYKIGGEITLQLIEM